MIDTLLVIPVYGGDSRIYKWTTLPFLPSTRDTFIQYEDSWSLSSIRRISILVDGSIELLLEELSTKEMANLVKNYGWSNTPIKRIR